MKFKNANTIQKYTALVQYNRRQLEREKERKYLLSKNIVVCVREKERKREREKRENVYIKPVLY